jgi:putative membrane protein
MLSTPIQHGTSRTINLRRKINEKNRLTTRAKGWGMVDMKADWKRPIARLVWLQPKGESIHMSDANSVPKTVFSTSEKLAFERTRLAHERTMMAWTRTSMALITFGFAMYKLFEFVPLVTGGKPGEHVSPRAFAITLASLGNLSLLLAAVQHRLSLQSMRALGLNAPHSTAAILAGFLSLLGIAVQLVVVLGL